MNAAASAGVPPTASTDAPAIKSLAVGALQIAIGDRVDLLHDVGRRAGARHDGEPSRRFERLLDLLRNGRHVGQVAEPLRGSNG